MQALSMDLPQELQDKRGDEMAAIAKSVRDLDDLVQLLLQGLAPLKPWQRQALDQLAEVQREIQVLRMTITMERADVEIVAAGEALRASGRQIATLAAGSRADSTTKAAFRLVAQLSYKISAALVSPTGQGD